MKRFFGDLLLVLTNPACWLQNYGYSPEWDAELRRLMESTRFTDIGEHTAKLGGHLIWIANHPYASFRLEKLRVRPKRATILRAQRKMISDAILTELEAVA